MTDLLPNEDAIREACRQHAMTVTAAIDHAGFGGAGEPIRLTVDCSCEGLHMDGNSGEIMTYIQAHLSAHEIPVSPWWPRLHPRHPRFKEWR